MSIPNVLVVLVNWRRSSDTIECLKSLRRNTYGKFAVAVCENGSNDGSDLALRNYVREVTSAVETCESESDETVLIGKELDRDRYYLIESTKNLGFAGGNNLAYRIASRFDLFDYVWFLNNDTEVGPEAISSYVNKMTNDSSVGICGATLVYAHDRETVQAFGGARYNPFFGLVCEIGQGKKWPCNVDAAKIASDMTYVSGASMFVSKEFLDQVGLMSEDYFLYFEELDWALRARKSGFKMEYLSEVVVFHKEGAALGSGKSDKRSQLSEYYAIRNKLRITLRFYPYAFPTVYLSSWLQVLKRLLQGRSRHALLMAKVLIGTQRPMP
ncbi:glycosyltransferase family 2 protein [Methyloversatilis sp. NSM2]|uniref:glycosyltransferase family 2 protein n=1 Tax=Methyloversatilis sp. NSM2 TaxID=3134135 RepID=UPI00310CBF0D